MELICIKCPRGCQLKIEGDSVTGNVCPRGIDYAKEEMTTPMRMVTALVKSKDNLIIPVKTSREVPKTKIIEVLDAISSCRVDRVKIGDVILTDVCGTGVDIVVTGDAYISD